MSSNPPLNRTLTFLLVGSFACALVATTTQEITDKKFFIIPPIGFRKYPVPATIYLYVFMGRSVIVRDWCFCHGKVRR
ncbi:exported hypothetical protein [Vibrio chagasii]|nr:exported hypothetical protein [Vibrio chagasii]